MRREKNDIHMSPVDENRVAIAERATKNQEKL
jgi:hypothetical protein